ncbi:penicillin-binding protein 1C [bacterium]|nr:penicillin-binding protein 1C [bacterium]
MLKDVLSTLGRTGRIVLVTIALIVLFLLLLLLIPLPENALGPPASTVLLDRHEKLLRVYLSPEDGYHIPVKLDRVSPYLKAAVVTYEDRFFYIHPGLNPGAIARALLLNLNAGRIVSGGSTITQQLARMIDRRPRTLPVKLLEAFRALQLELRYSKDEILAAYLNHAPFGGNVIGVEAASRIYFGKPALELGPGEAALLAALPQSPTRLRPDLAPGKAKDRRDEVLHRMQRLGVIDEKQYARAVRESAAHRRKPFPLHAPHLCDDLHARLPGRTIMTTIDAALQQTASEILKRHMNSLRGKHISNAAVVILENETGALRALIGSADYFDLQASGQVNGATAVRSPGSTLKPFVYALAMDQGRLTPSNLLEDIPVNYSGYEPANYDEVFHGMVTMRHALTHSLNVPAVNTLQQVGLTGFLHLLKQGGVSTLEAGPDHFGLSLILGGGGVRLLELTNLYAMLARQGRYLPYRLLENRPAMEEERLLSEGSARLITDILTEVRRPDFPPSWETSVYLPMIAWKTGTSYGHRDAWSIGYNPRWTIGVWIGNFSGEGAVGLVGSEAAGPLLFDLFNALSGETEEWYEMPTEVGTREVCVLSGMPPGPGCAGTVQAPYLRDRSPRTTCTLHSVYQVDDSTGYRLCPLCRPGRAYHDERFVTWPARVASWRREQGMHVEPLPRHFPDCNRVAASGDPEIHSPVDDVTYVIRLHAPLEDQQILLEAAFAADVTTVYWFVDEELVYEGPPDRKVFLPPVLGQHTVVCMDDEGRKASRDFEVAGGH